MNFLKARLHRRLEAIHPRPKRYRIVTGYELVIAATRTHRFDERRRMDRAAGRGSVWTEILDGFPDDVISEFACGNSLIAMKR